MFLRLVGIYFHILQSFDFSQTIYLKNQNVKGFINLLNNDLSSMLYSKNHSKCRYHYFGKVLSPARNSCLIIIGKNEERETYFSIMAIEGIKGET